jgi:hypothetical protein
VQSVCVMLGRRGDVKKLACYIICAFPNPGGPSSPDFSPGSSPENSHFSSTITNS